MVVTGGRRKYQWVEAQYLKCSESERKAYKMIKKMKKRYDRRERIKEKDEL